MSRMIGHNNGQTVSAQKMMDLMGVEPMSLKRISTNATCLVYSDHLLSILNKQENTQPQTP